MKPGDIAAALERAAPHRVLVRNGGWHGHPHQVLQMAPAFEDAKDTWVVSIFSTEGVHVHDMWVDADNLLAVCVTPEMKQIP